MFRLTREVYRFGERVRSPGPNERATIVQDQLEGSGAPNGSCHHRTETTRGRRRRRELFEDRSGSVSWEVAARLEAAHESQQSRVGGSNGWHQRAASHDWPSETRIDAAPLHAVGCMSGIVVVQAASWVLVERRRVEWPGRLVSRRTKRSSSHKAAERICRIASAPSGLFQNISVPLTR